MVRDKQASHGAKTDLEGDVAEAAVLPSAEMTRWQMHTIVRHAVDEIAPAHLNKKGRMAWAARELETGFDRARKAYHRAVKRIEHHEFLALADRYARLLEKQELRLAETLERNRDRIARWKARDPQNAAAAAVGAAAAVPGCGRGRVRPRGGD